MILYEDKDIIVCHKTAGLPVQSARLGQKDMVSILNNHLAEKAWEASSGTDKRQAAQRQPQFVHVVHRLDQPVEGVIVFAKNPKAAAHLTKQIQQDSVKKIYQAVCCIGDKAELLRQKDNCCQEALESTSDKSTEIEKADKNCGKLSKNQEISGISADTKQASGTTHLEDYLVKDGRTNTSRIASKKEKDAKLAVLDYEVLAERDCYKLVQVYLKTGRHHQIRVQMAHAGLPLYGDQKYNEKWQEFERRSCKAVCGHEEAAAADSECTIYRTKEAEQKMQMLKQTETYVQSGCGKGKTQLALCAVTYSFKHPSTGKEMKFEVKPENPVFGFFECE